MHLAVTLALAGCAGQELPAPFSPPAPQTLAPAAASLPASGSAYGRAGGDILLLVPLTGPLAPVGQALENAAKLAVPAGGTPGSDSAAKPALDIRDTGGTATGAAAAAQAGIAAGDGMIIGPLTSAETQIVAPIARAAGVNMLPFTNDANLAQPGVWPLGITPAQSVQRVLQVAAAAGHNQLAALLPDNEFGHELNSALTAQTQALSEAAPQITFFQPGFAGVNQAVNQLSDFADRGQGLMDEIKAAKAEGTPAGRAKARALAAQPVPPPNFDALFIGATDETTLAEIANFLPYYEISPAQVQLLGPAPWANIATDMAHQSVFIGALYAAPDPQAAQDFAGKYLAAYGAPAPAIAGIAFDAAALARIAANSGGYTSAILTAPAGFTGTDGLVVLGENGNVQRGLAVFSVQPGAPVLSAPAPATLTQPQN